MDGGILPNLSGGTMTPWFVLSYPRSRTAWLSVFLTGAGVPCFHEAWGQVTTVKQLRTLMESKGDGPVVNSDCSNVFFFDDLQAEFPDAHYVRLDHSQTEIQASLLQSYGLYNYQPTMDAYQRAFQHVESTDMTVDGIVDCAAWDESVSAGLYRMMTGHEVDARWLTQITGMLIQLMPETINRQLKQGRQGAFTHITRRMVSA